MHLIQFLCKQYHKSLILCLFWRFGHEGFNRLSKNSQECSPDTLLYFEEVILNYKKQQRKKLHMTKQGSTALKYHKSQFLCDFCHEGVNIWKCSRVLLGTLLYFEEATPSYKKQQRKKLHMTKQGSTALKYHKSIFGVILAMKGG